jgi:hypothetical protein
LKNAPPPVASELVYDAFVALPIVVTFLLWFLHRRARPEVRGGGPSALAFGVFLFLWLWTTGGIGLSGVLGRFDLTPPPFVLLMVLTLGLAFYAGLSRLGATLAAIPLAWLVGLQAFRFPLEIVMHRAAVERVMPEQMSYTGWNFDILTGITALLLAPAIATGVAPRRLIAVWNVLGAALLLNIMTIAMASSPLFRAFGKAPHKTNTFVAFFPYVWLPTVLVAIAIVLHIAIARGLRAKEPGA